MIELVWSGLIDVIHVATCVAIIFACEAICSFVNQWQDNEDTGYDKDKCNNCPNPNKQVRTDVDLSMR